MIELINKFCLTKNPDFLLDLDAYTKQFIILCAKYCIDNNKGDISLSTIIMETIGEEKTIANSIYINTKQRLLLIDNIKNSMSKANIDKEDKEGKYCVTGKEAELLKYLELKQLLGIGSYGNVYAGCLPIPCGSDAYQFAVKLTAAPEKAFKFPYDLSIQFWNEIYLLKNILSPIVEKGICPNLPIFADSYTCSSCDLEYYNFTKKKMEKVKKPCSITITELATGGDMVKWLETKPREDELYSSLFQIMAGLHAIQVYGQILNNDIKAANILSYNVKPGGYWKYIIHGKDFYVPNYGKVFIVNDFGVSEIFNPKSLLINKNNYNSLGNRYAMIINGQYSYLNPTKSFTFCHPVTVKTKLAKPRETKTNRMFYGSEREEFTTGIGCINKKNNNILNIDVKFTEEQKKELERLGIPADTGDIEFYMHPEIIPAQDIQSDTQDAIRIFLGGTRMTQPQGHTRYLLLERYKKFLDNLRPYKSILGNRAHSLYSNTPQQDIAGYFIEDFFTNKKDYTKTPTKTSDIIEIYNMS